MRQQVNQKDAVDGTISFHDQARNSVYKLNDQTAKIFVRPKLTDSSMASRQLVPCGFWPLFLTPFCIFQTDSRWRFRTFLEFFYLPKMEHSRVQVGMTQHFMRSYSDLLTRTCHRHVHAMGGMIKATIVAPATRSNAADLTSLPASHHHLHAPTPRLLRRWFRRSQARKIYRFKPMVALTTMVISPTTKMVAPTMTMVALTWVHGYDIGGDDCFAHLELGFKFYNLSDEVDGVLGKTYRRGYVSKARVDVPMQVMGGADKYLSSSIFATDCLVSRFGSVKGDFERKEEGKEYATVTCGSGREGSGMVCKR
ncbi:hypothetical protein Vadar_009890 [Vaccinium darrowii]|uniref:Uncharacterized protein n=1 Tax=Vaccinium darrowii TaxID=229202 RepID=A0ACB7XGH8_9ERIC|nr:hypothetical protein Vadar_009890 [Vaccinium darrowii]